MNILSIENLTFSIADRVLFKDISLGLDQGQKLSLVGHNGTGKSTLLKTIAGKLPVEKGDCRIRKGVKVGYLDQVPQLDLKLTAKECVFQSGNLTAEAVAEYNRLAILADPDPDEMQKALEKMEEFKAWDYDAKVKQTVSKLGISDMEQKVSTMSGGQKKRLALAQLILSEPDFLILDEPTNHLDLEAIEWLEQYLSTSTVSILMVSHDRYFMDKISDHIIELDRGKIFNHKGNYAKFLENRSVRYETQAVEQGKAKNLYKKELERMRRQPKARGTKAKYREDAFYETEKKAKEDLSESKLQINIGSQRQGRKILELEHITKQFGDSPQVNDLSYIFKKRERLGIVGKNGVGKSTFLNMLTGCLEPDSGRVIKGETTQIGYFTQEAVSLNPENRVVEEVKEIAEYIDLGDGKTLSVGKFLELFLFGPDKQYTYISKLSGGEKKRLQLLKVLVKRPNFLILDEPTNDLDMDTMNVLEQYLESFPGCLILVSHDRYFMDKMVDQLFIFEGKGKIKSFNGNYTDYQQHLIIASDVQKPNKKIKEVVKQESRRAEEQKKATFNDRREFEDLSRQIDELVLKKKELENLINSGDTDYEKIAAWSKEIKSISNELDEKEFRWLELSEICG